MWPIYAQVVLSCFCHLGYGCLETGLLSPPAGYKFMLMSDVRKNFKPNSYVIMAYSDALTQGKLQGGNGNTATKINSRALPTQVVTRTLPAQIETERLIAADAFDMAEVPLRSALEGVDQERRRQTILASDGSGDGRFDYHADDSYDEGVWREDVSVVAVVVDPGRRVRMFTKVDDGDDGDAISVAAVDACILDTETTEDTIAATVNGSPEAVKDDELAIATLYFPVVNKLAKQIVPGIRWQQVLSLALNAARATSDAVKRLTATTRNELAMTYTPVGSTHNVLVRVPTIRHQCAILYVKF